MKTIFYILLLCLILYILSFVFKKFIGGGLLYDNWENNKTTKKGLECIHRDYFTTKYVSKDLIDELVKNYNKLSRFNLHELEILSDEDINKATERLVHRRLQQDAITFIHQDLLKHDSIKVYRCTSQTANNDIEIRIGEDNIKFANVHVKRVDEGKPYSGIIGAKEWELIEILYKLALMEYINKNNLSINSDYYVTPFKMSKLYFKKPKENKLTVGGAFLVEGSLKRSASELENESDNSGKKIKKSPMENIYYINGKLYDISDYEDIKKWEALLKKFNHLQFRFKNVYQMFFLGETTPRLRNIFPMFAEVYKNFKEKIKNHYENNVQDLIVVVETNPAKIPYFNVDTNKIIILNNPDKLVKEKNSKMYRMTDDKILDSLIIDPSDSKHRFEIIQK